MVKYILRYIFESINFQQIQVFCIKNDLIFNVTSMHPKVMRRYIEKVVNLLNESAMLSLMQAM